MKNKTLNNIFLYVFILFSLIVIIVGILFIISQMVNIKYYFDDSLPNSISNSNPICAKEFFLEMIWYAKIIVIYAVYGFILAIFGIRRNKLNYNNYTL